MTEEKIVSRYCLECLQFTTKQCNGKSQEEIFEIYWGTKRIRGLVSGLNFCKHYIFDERLYEFPDGSVEADTFENAVERGRQTKIKQETEELIDDFDLAMNLSSDDFKDLV
jgi:hypothetical protein